MESFQGFLGRSSPFFPRRFADPLILLAPQASPTDASLIFALVAKGREGENRIAPAPGLLKTTKPGCFRFLWSGYLFVAGCKGEGFFFWFWYLFVGRFLKGNHREHRKLWGGGGQIPLRKADPHGFAANSHGTQIESPCP